MLCIEQLEERRLLSGSVVGSVFLDVNGDGVRQASETGLPGWIVQLKDNTGEVIRSTQTDASGNFSITAVDNGTYALSEASVPGWLQTAGPPLFQVQVSNGSLSTNNAFGDFQLGTIAGEVFAYAPTSPRPVALKNWPVQLLDANGAIVGLSTTNALGVYDFTGVRPGQYQVRQVLPSGWVQTGGKQPFFATVTSGSYSPYNVFGDFQALTISGTVYQDLFGSGAANSGTTGLQGWTVELRDSAGGLVQQTTSASDGTYSFVAPANTNYTVDEVRPTGWRQTAGSTVYPIAATSATTVSGIDFGDYLGGTVSGVIFQDVKGSGVFELGDPGLPGFTVQLLAQDGTVFQQTTTQADGTYALASLPVGYYTVSQVVPTGWTQSIGPTSYTVIVAPGSNAPDNSFGDVETGSVSGTVFQDMNGDATRQGGEPGFSGLTLQLLDAAGNVIQQTTTALDGNYNFLDVTAGRYTVNQVLPSDWTQTTGPNSSGIVVANGITSAGNNFGDFQNGTISGAVLQSVGAGVMQGLPGWAINLTDGSGTFLQQATSDSTGSYSFTSLTAGIYMVQPIFPDGWSQGAGASSYTVVVISGTNSTGNDFGDYQPAGISGTVFNDVNRDGIQQPSESGIQGQTVQLLDRGGNILRQTVSSPSGSYSFTGLQIATYTVRSLTPAGWTQTAGSTSYTITVASGTRSTGNNFGESKPNSNVVVIDAAWLSAQGSAPYILNLANTTYTLTTDVDVPGTAFVIGAPNVVFDLNGHTVTYGDSAPIRVTNGGFEQGSGANVPGWDLSAASTAVLKPARIGMWGNNMLEIPNFTAPQSIVSNPIAIPTANREYAASITPYGSYGTTVTIKAVDSITGQVLGSGSSAAVNRGFGAVVQFTPTTTDPVKLEVDLIPPSGAAATVDLDYATLTTSRDYGIVASPSSWYFPSQLKTSAVLAVANQVATFTLQNGSVMQGQGNAYSGTALNLLSLRAPTINNVTAFVDGMDTVDLEGVYANSISVLNSIFKANIDNISDRMLDFAAIHLGNNTGNILVDGNTILNYPQQGINVSNNTLGTVTITNNKISQRAIVTDGYAIAVSGVSDFAIANNNITPVQGRGILLDSWNSAVSRNGDIHGNYVSVSEAPNLEYGVNGLEATALRIRNWSGAQKNVTIHDNTFSATTGVGGVWDAIGLRVTQQNDVGQATGDNIQIEHNTFKAIVTTTNPSYQAMAVSLSGIDAGTGLDISNNVMESNQVSLNVGDNDSYAYHETDVRLVGNTMTLSSDGAARTYSSVQVGGSQNTTYDLHLIDTHYAGGATSALSFIGSKPLDIETGYLLSILAQNAAGALTGATVTIFDNSGAQVYTGTTGSTRRLNAIPLVTATYTQPGTDPTAITSTSSGPFKVVVTFGSISLTQEVDLTADKSLVFSF